MTTHMLIAPVLGLFPDTICHAGNAAKFNWVGDGEVHVSLNKPRYMLLKQDGKEVREEAADVMKSLSLEFHPATRVLADTAAD